MLSKYKVKVERIIQPSVVLFTGVNPNVLTFLGLIPPIVFYLLMANKFYFWALVSFVGVFFDFFDGAVARLMKKESTFGGFLDSTLDRIADILFITGFAVASLISWQMALWLSVVSLMISYVRSRAELANKGKGKFNVGWIERSERLLFLAVALGIEIVFPGEVIAGLSGLQITLWVLVILSLVTLIQRLIGAYYWLN